MKIKQLVKVLGLGALALTLGACGEASGNAEKAEASVGVLQFMEHESLDRAREGFTDALKEAGYEEGKSLTLNYQNAQGDQSNLQSITQQLAGKNDLILSIATPAAQAMLNTDKKTPQLFTAVTDPVSAKLVESAEKPGANMTGTSDGAPTDKVVDLLLKADPSIQTIGILYNSSEVNSEMQYKEAKDYIESKGLKVESMTVTTTNEIQQATKALAKKVDGIYLPTDNTVANTIQTIGQVLKEEKVPSVAAFDAGVEGTLCAYGVDYYELGKQTGQMAIDILKNGKNPADMPVQKSEKLVVKVNEDMAKALGIDPKSLTEE
ncbi:MULTISPECIES: ABC transporter substrate-binding protein [Aerococcus]|uniref:ABC transporter substrate-binding protein n=1 Tax=Aerococcus sanguinicola TaxID=119206 RepID=A0A5N1GKA7_9LACT|nr:MULTISPECIES: ABC transporter substrate-binding protein [Aerococcus]KAA9300629.1 ABC transporter substrate-binding protein [Aerococcus sanguinicola]MDK6370129.1 ABC transporter substrate-binding protein [Aerococcus sp. UMB9870]MDK6680073.1 ABC transporter substrate-binding protein [Aerococcus sp. UMB8608]MDK6686234.1 ABC transporter substrate-binding protein [Aerococcus sp. UMB8623]MDK6939962.1 ABC transporter substrate-binding protein [Aerococcus sp. UMB8487]